MNRILTLALAATLSLNAMAQPGRARKEINANPLLSASNYLAYIEPTEVKDVAPKGYEAFYLTHYGRHGSRWLIGAWEYDDAIGILQRGSDAGQLTARGEELLSQLKAFRQTTEKRLGELTEVGERQHHGIGRRMAQRLPSVFKDKRTQIDARSTVVIRCILSMTAACEELAAANPKARIHNDVSESFQYYLNADWTERMRCDNRARWDAMKPFNPTQQWINPTRFWAQLFKDAAYRDPVKNSRTELMKRVFDIAGNMQSHDNGIDLYDLFTPNERFDLWKIKNIEWYIGYAQGTAPFSQGNLLKNIIQTADTIADSRTFRGATLRYGHEVCVMPLAALLELEGCYPEVPAVGLDTLHHAFFNYEIYPMASNIQLTFYRNKKNAQAPVLVKARLNEREVTLPGTPTEGKYFYRWDDLRQYYLRKLAAYDQQGE